MNKGQFSRQFFALFSGTVLAQVFNLASYPLLGRLHTPEQFGVLGTFIAASAIPGALACGRYELAIATVRHSGRRAMLWLCYSLSLVVATIATLLLSFYWWHQGALQLSLLAPMLFLAIVLTGVTNATTMFLIRHDAFRFAAAGVVVRTAVTVIVQLAVAWSHPSAAGLIVGFCIGLIAQAALGVFIAAREYGLGKPRRYQMRAMFHRFRRQVSVDLPGSLLSSLSINLIPFFLQSLYGMRAVGYFSVGQRIAVLPLQLFNDSFSQVFFQRAARARDERGEFWSEFCFTLLWSGLISLAMLTGLLLFAEPVMVLYMGTQWEIAGTILVILAPMLAIRSVALSLATSALVLKRPEWLLYQNLVSTATILLSVIISWWWSMSLYSFLIIYATMQAIDYGIFAAILAYFSRAQFIRNLKRKPVQ
jgi:lipopolysaccharide exporter